MSTALNEVLVHVDETIDEPTLLGIEQEIRSSNGVVSVGHRADRPHLMMVVYDSGVSRAAHILRSLQRRGLHAQLIGF